MRAAIVGGGVVGCAVALALARRGVEVVVFEARDAVGTAASGTNSGILHTGFDSKPGELETALILAANRVRSAVIETLEIPVVRCGALLRGAPAELPYNGVEAVRDGDDLLIPGEWVTDPVAFTRALAGAAVAHGAEIRVGTSFAPDRSFSVVVNCAGLHADSVARAFGDDSFAIYPRKGEFFVFDVPLDRILLPRPTARTKGVLVFPTTDGRCIAGPTAVDLEDKEDWSVRGEAFDEIMAQAVAMHPPLRDAEPIASYAGLRPAGRGVNYVVGRSAADERLINVAAIRSTGLSASLGIADHVAELVAPGTEPERLRRGTTTATAGEWWRK